MAVVQFNNREFGQVMHDFIKLHELKLWALRSECQKKLLCAVYFDCLPAADKVEYVVDSDKFDEFCRRLLTFPEINWSNYITDGLRESVFDQLEVVVGEMHDELVEQALIEERGEGGIQTAKDWWEL